jgi:flagellar hook-basal body complex protein FliE
VEINRINSLIPDLPNIAGPTESAEQSKGPSFSQMLEKSLTDTNDLIQVSDQKAKELAVGKTENLHEAMISFEKAETALKLLVQVRNKALEAYNQVLSMQV